jgi:L-alanine-DL-glutamate epimerase-like enolase superfamily enzyme
VYRALDECPLNVEKFSCPARNAVEIALFDAWGKLANKPVSLIQTSSSCDVEAHC